MDNKDYYTPEEKRSLLNLARTAIENALLRKSMPDTGAFSPKLHEKRSCFVTLHLRRNHQLKGCIGNIDAFEPLVENVVHNALNSAFHDPRFRPVSSINEASELVIEISVLTPPEPISGPDAFVVGRHGIILSQGRSSALFLPQVAPEQGWDAETTLTHLSLKAGLKPDSWKDPKTKFETFEAIVFSEGKED